jgi:hypothetical protein
MSNFFDMRCPKCGDEDHIDIAAEVWVRLTDDGDDADASRCGDHTWTHESAATCEACGHHGTVADFTPKPPPTPLEALKLIAPPYAELLRGVGADPKQSEAYQAALAAIANADAQEGNAP